MFDVSAEFYDLIYSTFKDYRTEANQIASLLCGLSPGCKAIVLLGGNPLEGYWNLMTAKVVLKGGEIMVDKR